jgi:hypothetical protein
MPDVITLYPYRIGATWVFDDPRTGLKEEAFVLGMSEMITRVIQERSIPEATFGFDLHFSDAPFDGYDVVVTRDNPWAGGMWYDGDILGEPMRGWLCPALLLYYATAPERIYMAARPLSAGVSPIWEPEGAPTRQFMAPQ